MICKKCGAKANSELCWKCKPKKPLSSSKSLNKKSFIAKPKEKDIVETLKKAIEADKLKQFFIEQWNTRPHYCKVSGKFLGNAFSTLYQHHLLEKRNYPEACLDGDNIVFLSPEIHASVELDKFKYEYINKKRELLKIKYNIL